MADDQLTPEQEKAMLEEREKLFQQGAACGPADRPRVERGITNMYKKLGHEVPEFVWTSSPLDATLLQLLLREFTERPGETDPKRHEGWAAADKLLDLWEMMDSQPLKGATTKATRKRIEELHKQLVSLQLDKLIDLPEDPGKKDYRPEYAEYRTRAAWGLCRKLIPQDRRSPASFSAFRGAQEIYWVGFYRFCATLPQVQFTAEQREQLEWWYDQCFGGWWWPYTTVCFCAERPIAMHWEGVEVADRRLHCDDGPAVAYVDGLKLYVIHGVVVDEQIVMHPETQTIEQIRSESQAEVQRIRIERYGWDRFLKDTDAKVVDQRENPIERTQEVLMKTDDFTVLVGVCPSTGRVYSMEVDNSINTCEAAQLWLSSGLSARTIDAS